MRRVRILHYGAMTQRQLETLLFVLLVVLLFFVCTARHREVMVTDKTSSGAGYYITVEAARPGRDASAVHPVSRELYDSVDVGDWIDLEKMKNK